MTIATTDVVHDAELVDDDHGPRAELVHRPAQSALSIREGQTELEDAQARALGIQNAPRADQAVFLHQCLRSGLDPFARQIYMIERQGKWTIQTAIDGFRLIAHRAAQRTGEAFGESDALWCGRDGVWRDVWLESGAPAAAKFTVYRNGQPFSAVAHFSEYAGTKRGGGYNNMWSTKPAVMIAKCAEALALRKAWPQDLSGIYTPEEMAQADEAASAPRSAQPAPRGPQGPQGVTSAPSGRQPVPNGMLAEIANGLHACGYAPEARAERVGRAIGRQVGDLRELSRAEAERVLETLYAEHSALQAQAAQSAQAQAQPPAAEAPAQQ